MIDNTNYPTREDVWAKYDYEWNTPDVVMVDGKWFRLGKNLDGRVDACLELTDEEISYQKAKQFAAELHEGQMYGNKPYTYHLQNVEHRCTVLFGKDKHPLANIICWLHDIVEDCDTTVLEVVQLFGDEVGFAVSLLTKHEGYNYNQHLRDISMNTLAWQVKVADTFSNLTHSVIEGNFKRVRKYSTQLEKLYKFRGENTLDKPKQNK